MKKPPLPLLLLLLLPLLLLLLLLLLLPLLLLLLRRKHARCLRGEGGRGRCRRRCSGAPRASSMQR